MREKDYEAPRGSRNNMIAYWWAPQTLFRWPPQLLFVAGIANGIIIFLMFRPQFERLLDRLLTKILRR
jgi:hypothetical protein